MVLYRDDCLALDEDGMTIRRYYFPLGAPKRIAYHDIRAGWGTADPRFWLPLDLRRYRKDKLLVVDVGRRVKPCVSPDDPDRVVELLQTRVSVS